MLYMNYIDTMYDVPILMYCGDMLWCISADTYIDMMCQTDLSSTECVVILICCACTKYWPAVQYYR